ncbi:MAG TPA: hypothetical protein PLS67_03510 [Accumulibacter sp.]|nr:hypothetical protein [Accumulibacter sp.]
MYPVQDHGLVLSEKRQDTAVKTPFVWWEEVVVAIREIGGATGNEMEGAKSLGDSYAQSTLGTLNQCRGHGISRR